MTRRKASRGVRLVDRGPTQPPAPKYAFGQDATAARRLRLLDEIFRPTTEDLLRAVGSGGSVDCAVDLGCGPGTTTGSLGRILRPARLVGIDVSAAFLALAVDELPAAEFIRHDVLDLPWPVPEADLVYARYLLTHLPRPAERLMQWVRQVRPGGLVVVEDDTDITATNAVLAAYCAIVEEVLAAGGANLFVARTIDVEGLGLMAVLDREVKVRPSTSLSARMFRLNLASWSQRPAAQPFAGRLAELDDELRDLEASGEGGEITWTLRQLAIRRPQQGGQRDSSGPQPPAGAPRGHRRLSQSGSLDSGPRAVLSAVKPSM